MLARHPGRELLLYFLQVLVESDKTEKFVPGSIMGEAGSSVTVVG